MIFWNIISAFAAALLAAMGVGGGGLLVIYLVLVLKIEQHTAQGINLMFFLFASAAAILVHLKYRKPLVTPILFFSVLGSIGAYLGCILSLSADPHIVRICFGYLMVLGGVITLLKTAANFKKTEQIVKK